MEKPGWMDYDNNYREMFFVMNNKNPNNQNQPVSELNTRVIVLPLVTPRDIY